MISLAIWCNKHLKVFQRLQIALTLWAHTILMSLKILPVLINTKLQEESCYYLYKQHGNIL